MVLCAADLFSGLDCAERFGYTYYMRTMLSILTVYAYLAALQLAPSIPFARLLAAEQAMHQHVTAEVSR
jgi:hypothetical protein